MKKTKDYKSEYAQKLVAWFRDAPLFVEETKEVFSKKSDKIETIIEKQPAPCPSVVRFADNKYGYTVPTLLTHSNDSHIYAEGLPTDYNNHLFF